METSVITGKRTSRKNPPLVFLKLQVLQVSFIFQLTDFIDMIKYLCKR